MVGAFCFDGGDSVRYSVNKWSQQRGYLETLRGHPRHSRTDPAAQQADPAQLSGYRLSGRPCGTGGAASAVIAGRPTAYLDRNLVVRRPRDKEKGLRLDDVIAHCVAHQLDDRVDTQLTH